MATSSARFYVFDGTYRRRVPATVTSENAAVEYARSVNAVNLVREDGPPSKPTASRMVWSVQPKGAPAGKVKVVTMDGLTWWVDPRSLTRAD